MKQERKFLKVWKLIERENAVRYLMISLFSYIATISVVRSFLALTGYPQIGTGTLHIAHVLWGGLILFIAAVLPLIYLNPQLHTVGAILSGVGMGLFLDEVGKFITREYDYFFPAAAPIMYVFVLLLIVLVIMIRRPDVVDGRAELVQALEIVREQLYRPLELAERAHIVEAMHEVIETDPDHHHQAMADHLLQLVQSDSRIVPETHPAWWTILIPKFQRWLTEKRLSWLLGAGMVLLGVFTLKNPLQFWFEGILANSPLESMLKLHAGQQFSSVSAPGLFITRLGLEVSIGILLIVSFILLLTGKKRLACTLSYVSLLASLIVLDMLLFYFEQFSTIAIVLFQFILLSGVIYYRNNFLKTG